MSVVLLLAALGAAGLLLLPAVRAAVEYAAWRVLTWRRRRSGHVTCGDCQLYYERTGQGAPLILLHGGLASRHVWFHQLPQLSRHFSVFNVDLRGHGRSTRGSQVLSYELLASDVLALMDTLQLDAAHLVGWSDGANTALVLALQHPQRVHRIVALSANADPRGLTSAAWARLRADVERRAPVWARLIHRRVNNQQTAERMWREVMAMWAAHPQLADVDLAGIGARVLLMRGEHDDISRTHTDDMARALPHAHVMQISRAGHRLLHDAAADVTAAVVEFLRRS